MNIHLFEYAYKIIHIVSSSKFNFTNGISLFNHEFIYLKNLNILDITDMQNKQKISKSKYTKHVEGVSIVPPMWVHEH